MSLSFSVSYQNIPKKVTCKNTASVNQLSALALEKFKLPATANGILAHNGKPLDGFTPLRLTGLVNNAKLTLTASESVIEATLKFVGSVDGTSVSTIVKAKSDAKLADVVLQVLQNVGLEISLESKVVELSVMRQAVRSSSPGFETMTVASLAGSLPSAVVRIKVEDTKAVQEREESRDRETERLPAVRKSDVKPIINKADANMPPKNVEQSMLGGEGFEANPENAMRSESANIQANGHANALNTEPKSDLVSQSVSREQTNTTSQSGGTQNGSPASKIEPASISPPEALAAEPTETPKNDSHVAQPWSLPVYKQDTLYVPSAATTTYENPDEDYELTSNQAEKYYKILKSMQGRPPKKVAKVPTKYTIRIRFPDRALLDLHFADPATKLGQLLKKLDTYLLAQHVNSYTLKNGLPPFDEISFGFGANGTPLQEHPLFQQEKILLIWESQNATPAPYLKSELQRKDVSELPTVLLDSHRGDLEAEVEAAKKANVGGSSPSQPGAQKKPRPKGMPKWFRP